MTNTYVTILGCGSSGGVPRIGNDWGACDPSEPRNRRRRCAILVEQFQDDVAEPTRVLIDTPPDLREQLLDADVGSLDAVIFTHAHADQCHGIDDLRAIAIRHRRQIDIYMDEPTTEALTTKFDYCFVQLPGSSYVPILKAVGLIEPGTAFEITGAGGPIAFTPILQHHGHMDSLGFRIGNFAYCNDVVSLPEESFALLEGIDMLVVDALRYTPHPSHAHLDLALEWIERLKPKQSILTNLHVDMDYRTLVETLPRGVEPAYDSMRLHLQAHAATPHVA